MIKAGADWLRAHDADAESDLGYEALVKAIWNAMADADKRKKPANATIAREIRLAKGRWLQTGEQVAPEQLAPEQLAKWLK